MRVNGSLKQVIKNGSETMLVFKPKRQLKLQVSTLDLRQKNTEEVILDNVKEKVNRRDSLPRPKAKLEASRKLIPNKHKYSKYLKTQEDKKLSRGNKLYVKRILKQNKEYRQMQVSFLLIKIPRN